MRRALVLVALTLASAVTSVLLAVAVNVATGGELPPGLAPAEPLAWPAVAVAGLVTAVLAYWQQRPLGGAEPEPVAVDPARPTPPAELPALPALFTGRQSEADRILAAIDGGAPLVAVSGPGGVGKSALILHVAHLVHSRYPDGTLFVRLRGASSEPADPAEVLPRLLRSLRPADGDDGELRGDVETLAARLRTRLAGRRYLLVFDDAGGADQVRPLLPGASGSLVLVTSRPVLAELTSATLVGLEEFSDAEARELLARLAGDQRVSADPAATEAVVRACGNLPLAVAIAGSRLRARPSWSMATLAGRLADEERRLDELSSGRDAVRASVAATYTELDAYHQRVFRRLGAHPGTDFDASAAAALADLVGSGAVPALDRLVERQLVQVTTSDRYRLHDLLRLYAIEELGAEYVDALRRLADHYAARARAAIEPWVPWEAAFGPRSESGDPEHRAYVDDERENLIATVTAAAQHRDGHPELREAAWSLAAAAEPAFTRYPYHADARRLWEAGLAIAHSTGVPERIAQAEYAAARASQYSGDVRGGLAHARASLSWWERAGHRLNTAAAHRRLASALYAAGLFTEAEEHYGEALRLCAEHPGGEGVSLRASALRGLGSLHLAFGRIDDAVRTLQKAVDVRREAGDDAGLARARTSLARAHRKAGRIEVARELVTPQIAVFRRLGDVMWEITALRELGRLELAEGRLALATDHLEAARVLALRNHNRTGAVITLVALAEVDAAAGRSDAAAARFREAAEGFHAAEDRVREGTTQLKLALLLARTGAGREADAAAERARAVLTGLDVPDAADLWRRLAEMRGAAGATPSDLGG
ncbi:ATP-binding protein [Cryptosporangium arvum]|uniref:NB-ARC domain protein n=1 Tax=Cryptosporangium arvum DSM 44712 TaxID=927661 RepID=A0A010YI81_9ACTN|nr:tetratricopeptide repeat protein [Cryptosporangium arvum]EXG79980.1 NB-ARC domain protein [Cryptosporangium arvum DSM 44712]